MFDYYETIENQERRGQQSVIANQQLPKHVNELSMWEVCSKGITKDMDYDECNKISTHNNITYTKEQYKKNGYCYLGRIR